MAANKEEQKPQKASKYYPAEDVAVPKKVCSPMRSAPMHPEEEDRRSTIVCRQHHCSRCAALGVVEGPRSPR
jgi:hypothetical protein